MQGTVHPGENVLETRTRNQWGVTGPVSIVKLRVTEPGR